MSAEIVHVTDPEAVAQKLDRFGALWDHNVCLTQPFVMQLSLIRCFGWKVAICTIVHAQELARGRREAEPFTPDCIRCQDSPATHGLYCAACNVEVRHA